MVLSAAMAAAMAAVVHWTVHPNTDWPSNLPGKPSCPLKAQNASACAAACFALEDCVATSWNECGAGMEGDCCCNLKCSTNGQTHKLGEAGVVVRPDGGDRCHRPPKPWPPPPPPPPPLCPSTMPAEWRAACLRAELFYEDPAAIPQVDSLLPEVANGASSFPVQYRLQ